MLAIRIVDRFQDLADVAFSGFTAGAVPYWDGSLLKPAPLLGITSSGNVGIGTTSPAAKLEVHGTDAATQIVVFNDAAASISNFAKLELRTNTDTQSRAAGALKASFSDLTDATRTSLIEVQGFDSGAGLITRLAIKGSNVGVGTISPATEFHVASVSAIDPRGIMSSQHTTDAIGARVHLRKSRGSVTVPTIVVTGDILGRVMYSGWDGATYVPMVAVDGVAEGTIAATRIPTRVVFSTATDALPSVLTEALRLDSSQNATFAGSITLGSGKNIVLSTTTGTKIGTGATQKLGFYNAAPVVQQTDGATLTNNAAVNGTTNQIDDFAGAVYATDGPIIQRDMYQLARKLKIVDDALRAYGLLS